MIINCPFCSGPIFKTKAEDVSFLELSTKCPHCREIIEVQIKREIIVLLNGRKVEALGDKPKLRTL